MNFKEQFSRKLYNPRSIEGVANNEVFEIVEIIHQSLADEKEFVAIEPFGSSVNGYSTVGSDVDIRLYFEVPDIPEHVDTDEFVSRCAENHRRTEELKKKALETLAQMNFDTSTIHVLIFTLSKAENVTRIQHGLREEGDAGTLGALFNIVKGDRIKEFRDSAVEQLKKLSEEERNRQVDLMAAALSESELMSFRKIDDRTDESLDYLDLRKMRTEMWKARILTFLD